MNLRLLTLIGSILLLGWSSHSIAAIEAVHWPVLQSDAEVFMAGEIYKNDQYKGDNLDLNLSSNRGELAALGYYYKSAKKQNYEALERLHYLKDGSRNRFLTELKKIPDKYEGFTKLDKVQIGDLYYWGDYVVADVEWFGSGKRLARWREAMACRDYCFITDRFLVTTPSVDAFSAGLYSYAQVDPVKNPGDLASRNRLDNEIVYLPPSGGGVGHPFTVSFRLADYPKKAVLVKSKVKQKDKKKKSTGKKKAKGDSQILFDFVSSVWQQKEAVEELIKTSDFDIANKKINDIYTQHWRNFNPNLLMPMYEFSDTDSGAMSSSVSLFTAYALFNRVASWNKVEALSYMRSNASTYLVVRAEDGDGVESLQVFYIQKDPRGNKELTANLGDVAVQNIVKTPEFGSKLAKMYLTPN